MSELADNCKFFKSHGFEVGAWIWTFLMKENTKFKNKHHGRSTDG